MQICRRKLVSYCFVLLLSSFLFSEEMAGISMPSLPSMPSISLDGSFYKPSYPYVPDNAKSKNEDTEEKKETIITDGEKKDDIFESLINPSNTLLSSDISNLSDYGLFSDVTSLLGGVNDLSQNNTNTILLQQILKELNELKKNSETSSKYTQEENSNNKKDSENFYERNPSLLRFKINDYDIIESLIQVFVSRPSSDGSFIFTADRKYIADKKTRSETFYLLFTPSKNSGSNVSYSVSATVSQDYKNENSFIYKLCKKDNLTAQKTGNLVVLKCNDKDLKVDLLIDIDKR